VLLNSPLDAASIRRGLLDDSPFHSIECHARLGSTSDRLRELACEGAPAGQVVIAEEQTDGRGRLGRRWHSPQGFGLYLSLLLAPTIPMSQVTRWTLGASLAACRACRDLGARAAEISWPNDLMIGPAKLAGILAELRSRGGAVHQLIVGVGINVGPIPDDLPRELRGRVASLHPHLTQGMLGRAEVAACLLNRMAHVARALDDGAWPEIAAEWTALAPEARGQRVRVTPGDGIPFAGTTRGIADDGALIVERDDGTRAEVRLAGSVRRLE